MELLTRYGPFVVGALAAAILGAYTLRSNGRDAGRTVVSFLAALGIFIVADIVTGQALTRPDLGFLAVALIGFFGLAVILAIGVLARRARTKT